MKRLRIRRLTLVPSSAAAIAVSSTHESRNEIEEAQRILGYESLAREMEIMVVTASHPGPRVHGVEDAK